MAAFAWAAFVAAAYEGARHDNLGYVYWRNATKRTTGSVIPWPKRIHFTSGSDYLKIRPNKFIVESQGQLMRCNIVAWAQDRYLKELFFDDVKPEDKDATPTNGRQLGSLDTLRLATSNQDGSFRCDVIPQVDDMDEAYNLTVASTSSENGNKTVEAHLEARSCWGILRGLETFSQLVFNLKGDTYAIRPVEVEDEPRFKHRGFMLDTARHYISLEKILDLIDAMAFNKLNIFHWHMVDDQSFPYESSTYPQLSKRSSYRPELVYSRQTVQAVIFYAAIRGIRVMPELDTPGHSYTLRHVPNVLSVCHDEKTKRPNGDFGPIDPTNPNAYKSVNRLLAELASVFPEQYFHAGGDEVDFDCWKSNPDITEWMVAQNMSGNYEELSNYYIRRLYNMIKGHKKTMLVWQEVFDFEANLPKDTIIHVWKDINNKPAFMKELNKVVRAGYQALLSSCWYLNYIDYGQDWIKYYQCDPADSKYIDPQFREQILGGEICMWTEFVDDTNVVSRTWPRASAAAERLWSPETSNNVNEFLNRLEQHRCRLTYRGIQAEPVNGPGYC